MPDAPEVDFNMFSGYLPISDTTNYFYWFAECDGCEDPASAPLALWTNGGPGCSGLIGMMTEQVRTILPDSAERERERCESRLGL